MLTIAMSINLDDSQKSTLRHEVRLEANGGAVTPDQISVFPGGTYDGLPIPTWGDNHFAGWFTDTFGGEQVLADDMVSDDPPSVLFARWEASQKKDSNQTVGSDVDPVLAFSSIVADYRTAVQNATVDANQWYRFDQEPLAELTLLYTQAAPLQDYFGYCYRDLNGDQVPELLLVSTDSRIYAIYTILDENTTGCVWQYRNSYERHILRGRCDLTHF